MSDSDISRTLSSTDSSTIQSPPPSELQQLKTALSMQSDETILEHCLGLHKLQGVSSLADCMVVVCFDTESWTRDHDRLTEIGVATFDSRDMGAVKEPGSYGENLLKQVYFYHARIQENAHLVNIKFCVGDPDSNRFGQTRFVTKDQASNMLRDIFAWPIDKDQPELGYCPVVVVGHALRGDFSRLHDTLGFNAAQVGTVVKMIDTQQLSRETGYWSTLGNPIGLARLVPKCGFDYRDPHTASNDAAMTLVCAVQMVLPNRVKNRDITGKSLQTIVDQIEKSSQQQTWTWGNEKYCIRCGGVGHTKTNYRGRRCNIKVKCAHCAASKLEKRQKAAGTHCTRACISFAMEG
ncbi:hypothetical protein N0V83_000368 [Neocucurbitaria cava]|uniref:Gfd2/YDR514C-like C-terminal domain-containing protein n=1 Tax=Neocucurbitaria cava TaxID=798079 RepID=A0A9W9CRX9_9PLEO|nr:hypothetical protein N0V83_000368 [Neocucurbitaria cava]